MHPAPRSVLVSFLAWPFLAWLFLAWAAVPGPARAADASVPLCQIDAADSSPGPAWIRIDRLLERVRTTCAPGDVLWLFAYDRNGHVTDPATVAPLICRFDHQILLHEADGDGPRRLACVYAGGTRTRR